MSNLYLIKDISRITGLSIHTIKFYLKLGLVEEVGRSPETGYRYFDDSTVEELQNIRRMRKEGLSISDIKKKLGGQKV